MTGQIDCVDGATLGQLVDVEEPVVGITAESMDQHDRRRVVLQTGRLEDERPALMLELPLDCRAGVVCVRLSLDHETRNEAVNVRVGDAQRRQNREEGPDR